MSDINHQAETYVPDDSFRERSPSTDRSVIMGSPARDSAVIDNGRKEPLETQPTNSHYPDDRRPDTREYERRDTGYSSNRYEHRGYPSRDVYRKIRIQTPEELRYPEGAEMNKDLVYCIVRNVHKLDITLSKMGLLEYVDIPSIVKTCIMKPADADNIINEFDLKCKRDVSNPSHFTIEN